MPNNLVFNNIAGELLTQIYATDGNTLQPIKTDSNGRLEVVGTFTYVVNPIVVEESITLQNVTGTGWCLDMNTSPLSAYSFYVYNLGSNSFKVKLQVSPQNLDSHFVDDCEFIIDPVSNPKAVLVPKFYMKYTRLAYETLTGSASAEVYFNGKV